MRRFLAFLAAACMLLGLAPKALAEECYGLAPIYGISADRVHLRATPGGDSLGLYFNGTQALCLTDPARSEWTRVRLGTEEGYIRSRYLAADGGAAVPSLKQGAVQCRENSWVNLRAAPDRNAEVLLRLKPGDTLNVLGETAGHWYWVRYRNTFGYVMASYVVLSDAPEKAVDGGQALALLQRAMAEEVHIWLADSQRYARLSALLEADETFGRYALADLDGDSLTEIVLEWMKNGEGYGYVVLDWQDGQAVAIQMVYRALLMLKGDGTFSWSSGAADNGFGRMLPGWYGYELQVDSFMESDESGSIIYTVNGQEVKKSVYDGVLVHQNAKPDAIWYGGDRTEGSIG